MRHWPLYDLRLRTERLELRLPDLDLLEELIDVAVRGVHPPETMPFGIAWTDRPSPQMEREAFQHHLRRVAEWRPDSWTYGPVALLGGRVIGAQDLRGENFAASRVVSTGSWLGREFQGLGLGREMRAAVLELAFANLGALEAYSEAFSDNAASVGVSRALGYEPNGVWRRARRGRSDPALGLRLTRERWGAHRDRALVVEGLQACLELFGLPATPLGQGLPAPVPGS